MAPWNANASEMAIMNQVQAKLIELGMYTMVRWNFIFIAPPLTITEAQMDEGLEIISEALKIADAHCN
jgi:taurine--2-oxoglutarate transaminase